MKKYSPINEFSKDLVKLFWLVMYIYIYRKRGEMQIKFHYIYIDQRKKIKNQLISNIII